MTLLEHLNAVSIERGFRDFSEALEYPELHVISIIEMAGKDYSRECVVNSLEKASENAEVTFGEYGQFQTIACADDAEVNKESITTENNIILL